MLSTRNTIFDFMENKELEDGFKEALKMLEYFNIDGILPSCGNSSLSEIVHYKNSKKCTEY